MTHSKHRRSYTLRTDVSHNTTLGRLLTTNMLQRKMRSKKIKLRTDRTRKELLFLPMQIRVDSSCRGRGARRPTQSVELESASETGIRPVTHGGIGASPPANYILHLLYDYGISIRKLHFY